MHDLSLVIPLYNEEQCLKKNFETIKVYLDTLAMDYEIILVNDGSNDSTMSIIGEIVQRNSCVRSLNNLKNRGKGHAVRSGVLSAAGEYVVFADADLAVPPHFIGACLKRLEAGTPMVIGSRHLPGSSFKVREGALRQFLGEVFRRFAQFSLGLRVSDITCGLKGFQKKAAFDIFSRSKIDRWGYDVEIIFLAQKLGYVIEEIPVDWYHSFDSKVRPGIDSLRTLMEMCRVHYYYLSKQYKC
ncbi:MAG: glycosyltransferase family 2 protein [Deltaproteobacteria bacterium]|nr:MAG: glycosyltransferase family 2 protein [Deltaproteobacteria bacterium]